MSLPPPPPAGRLTAGERAVLAFARAHPGRCTDPQVRAGLGMSATAYYQRLLALLDRAEAAAAAPALIARLRADRDRRRAWRTPPEHTPPPPPAAPPPGPDRRRR